MKTGVVVKIVGGAVTISGVGITYSALTSARELSPYHWIFVVLGGILMVTGIFMTIIKYK
jgi:hypothetical protein